MVETVRMVICTFSSISLLMGSTDILNCEKGKEQIKVEFIYVISKQEWKSNAHRYVLPISDIEILKCTHHPITFPEVGCRF